MLCVVYDDGTERNWYVNEKFTHMSMRDIRNVVEVQADGDELNHIFKKCRDLPTTDSRVISWYGDHAKFIVGNVLR